MTNNDEFLSVAQVAASLGVSSESVRRKISRGDLAAIKLGLGASPLRIARAELDHYIRIHQVVPR